MDEDLMNLYDLALAPLRFQTLNTAILTGIFEAIGTNKLSLDEIINKLPNLRKECLEKVLNGLVAMKYVIKTSESDRIFYENAPASLKYLLKDSPESYCYVVPMHGLFYEQNGKLKQFLEGKIERSAAIFNKDDGEIALGNELSVNPTHVYQMAMNQSINFDLPLIEKLVDFNKVDSVCDLAGGVGHMMHHFAKLYPKVSFTIFDTKATLIESENIFPSQTRPSNMVLYPGDLFKTEFPKAQIYIYRNAYSIFNAEQNEHVFKECYKKMNSGDKVIVLSQFFVREKVSDIHRAMTNISYMTANDGEEKDYETTVGILERAGFERKNVESVVMKFFMDAIIVTK